MIQSYYGIFPYTFAGRYGTGDRIHSRIRSGCQIRSPEICYPEEGELTILSITQNGKPFEGIISDEEQRQDRGKCWEDADPRIGEEMIPTPPMNPTR